MSLSGLIRKTHRRGQKRRYRTRLALRTVLYLVVIAFAAVLSAGVIHVVERPVPPLKVLANATGAPMPPGHADPFAPAGALSLMGAEAGPEQSTDAGAVSFREEAAGVASDDEVAGAPAR